MHKFMHWLHSALFRPTRRFTLFLGFMSVVWGLMHFALNYMGLDVAHPMWGYGVLTVGVAQVLVGVSGRAMIGLESTINTAAAGVWSYVSSAVMLIEFSVVQLIVAILFAIACIFVTLRLKYRRIYRSHCMAE